MDAESEQSSSSRMSILDVNLDESDEHRMPYSARAKAMLKETETKEKEHKRICVENVENRNESQATRRSKRNGRSKSRRDSKSAKRR